MSVESGREGTGAEFGSLEYFIEGHMEEGADYARWHYSEEGWASDIVASQLDIEVLTPEQEYRLSVVEWLGPDTFDEGVYAYGVRDLDGGPLITWPGGAQDVSEVECFDVETGQPVDAVVPQEVLARTAHLLRYGTPVKDALAETKDTIHKKPPFSDAVMKLLEKMGQLPPKRHPFY